MRNNENLMHFSPTAEQYEKFKKFNSMTDEEQDKACIHYDDCKICPMAIHQYLLSYTKHTCVLGMTKKQFEIALDNADCDF